MLCQQTINDNYLHKPQRRPALGNKSHDIQIHWRTEVYIYIFNIYTSVHWRPYAMVFFQHGERLRMSKSSPDYRTEHITQGPLAGVTLNHMIKSNSSLLPTR